MRIGACLASLSILSVCACIPEPATLDQAQEEALATEVRETLAGLTEAMNDHDPERVLAFYRQDEEFIYVGCTYFMFGWETFSPRAGSYYIANPEVTFERELTQLQVLSPTVAVAALRGGSTEAESLFWTEVLVKEDGVWKIAHEHESWPGCSPPPTPHPFTTPSDTSLMGSTEDSRDVDGSGGP